MQTLMYQVKRLTPELNFTRIQQRYLGRERIINPQAFASARNSIVQVVRERNDEGVRDFNIGGIANLVSSSEAIARISGGISESDQLSRSAEISCSGMNVCSTLVWINQIALAFYQRQVRAQ